MKTVRWLNRAILQKIMRDAKERDAPVLRIGGFTRGDEFKSLIFTALSARTKDETTLKACERLFSKLNGPADLAGMSSRMVAKLIYGVGFYNTKAKSIIALSKRLVSDFEGTVPADFDSLVSLPGVGRKTANVVLAHAFGKNAIGVDVHVHRISNRLGIVRTKRPEETERRLVKIIPINLHRILNIALVSHGQTVCLPKIPLCTQCVLFRYCKRRGVRKYR